MNLKLGKAVKQIKNPYLRARSRYIKYYDKLPIDEKSILLESQHGGEFNGNIFSMVRYLTSCEKYKDYKIYLSCKKSKKPVFLAKIKEYGIKNVEIVILSTKKYFKVMASAKYLINDNTFLPFYIKKEGQLYLNTWHGTPLKTLGRKIKNDAANIGNPQRNFVVSDYILFPNDYTRDHMIEDYMISNIAKGKIIKGGYPRNSIFFDKQRANEIRKQYDLEGKKVYAYMPTFRGTARTGVTNKNNIVLLYNLFEIDERLNDDEVFYLNLHPVSRNEVDFEAFEHIKPFPEELETYDFLNAADCLVTDYSSVFFDFACTRKKIVLFTYDKEEYLRDRGLYISMDSLPFPEASNFKELLAEIRTGINYDDTEFMQTYCPYDSIDSCAKLCDQFILGDGNFDVESIPDNGKENILIYAGNMAPNGVTASLNNLLQIIDKSKRNYYISFSQTAVRRYVSAVAALPDDVYYYATVGGFNITLGERIIKWLFRMGILNTPMYMSVMNKRIKQNFERDFGHTNFDSFIQFSGYAPDAIFRFAQADKNNIIYVHSDMEKEIKVRGNQRNSVLNYAYSTYKKVAIVTEDIKEPTIRLGANENNIHLAKNAIPHKVIKEKSMLPAKIDEYTESNFEHEDAMKFLTDKSTKKFITVGRFSPEKGHDRLVDAFENFAKNHPDARLVIMGGSSYENQYDILKDYINKKGLNDKVLLLKDISNPHAIVKLCDYFVLCSHYEGFGLVLVEADIVGLPVISTDITGPRTFMQQNEGVLVPSSQQGIEQGLEMLYNGEVPKLKTDYEKYNRDVVSQFESLLK